MKFIYVLVFKYQAKNPQSITGCFDKKEMYMYEADNLNSDLTDTIWIINPEY